MSDGGHVEGIEEDVLLLIVVDTVSIFKTGGDCCVLRHDESKVSD